MQPQRLEEEMQRNETELWAHIYLSKSGTSPNPAAREHQPLSTVSAHHPLVRIVRRTG